VEFLNRVKSTRIARNLTQEELARLVEATRQTIGLIEANKYNPTIKLCLKLSKVLGKSLDELFYLKED